MTPKNALLAAALLVFPACDAELDECETDPGCEAMAEEGDPKTAPDRDPEAPPPTPSGPYCDATPLEGLSCDCGGLPVDVITHAGEIVADGEASVVLRSAGTGAFGFFGVCRDVYAWEEGDPSCQLVVMGTDDGCGGLALQHVPAAGSRPSAECPYVPADEIAVTCDFRDNEPVD